MGLKKGSRLPGLGNFTGVLCATTGTGSAFFSGVIVFGFIEALAATGAGRFTLEAAFAWPSGVCFGLGEALAVTGAGRFVVSVAFAWLGAACFGFGEAL